MPLYVCNRATPNRAYRFPDDVADGGTPSGAGCDVMECADQYQQC